MINNMFEQWQLRKNDTFGQNKKWLRKIAAKPPKDINSKANSLHEQVFTQINCLDCAGCCKHLPPIVNDTDIRRAARALGMKPAAFAMQYVVVDEDNDRVINATPCPFLEADNSCRIYESRPKSCREYPHTNDFQFIKNIRLHADNARYCPAVFFILEAIKKDLFKSKQL